MSNPIFSEKYLEQNNLIFMRIVCLADDSHECQVFIFSGKKKKKKKKIECSLMQFFLAHTVKVWILSSTDIIKSHKPWQNDKLYTDIHLHVYLYILYI